MYGASNDPNPKELAADALENLQVPTPDYDQSLALYAIPIGNDRILLKSADFSTARLEARLRKHWAKTLGLEAHELETLMQDSDFAYLKPYFEFDRTIRTFGGTLRISFDPQQRFDAIVLTSPDLRDQTESIAGRIIPAQTLEELSKTQMVDALVLDPDRISSDLASLSIERKRRETIRAMRDEVLPTLVSGILGELGMPQGRGSRGFDLLCEPHALDSKLSPTNDVQIKQMCHDSPIFKKDSLHGRKQFWKLVAILSGENNPGTNNKALLIQDSASDAQVTELLHDLVSAGVKREQIIVLDKERLKLSGIKLTERRSNTEHTDIAIQVDLQKFLRFSWAELVADMSDKAFHKVDLETLAEITNGREYHLPRSRESLDEPLEIALLRANGCLEIVKYCRRR